MPVKLKSSRLRSSLFAIWYLCIGVGFVLLGIRAWLLGSPLWTVALRWLIAAGFAALGVLELRRRRPGPP